MGWASGLQAGLQLGRAFREGQERRAMEEIQKAQATNIDQGYTAQMGEQLQGIATARDAQGNLAYQLTPQEGGAGYGLSVRNAEGGYTPVEGPGIQPQRVTEFLGQRYEGGLTPERMDAIRTRAMANAVSDPRQRQQMLMAATAEERAVAGELRAQQGFDTQQKLAQFQLNTAEDTEEQRKKLRRVDESYNEWFTKRVGDREPTSEDNLAGIQFRSRELAKAGLVDESIRATQNYLQIANAQIDYQTKDRTAAIGRTISAAAAGDLNAVKDFYNKFVPDGGQVTKVSGDAKTGYTIERTDLTGNKLPPVKISDMNQLSATLETFADPKALRGWAQQQFANNIATETLNIQKQNLQVQKDYKDAIVKGQTDARSLQSVREFTDDKGNTVLLDISKLRQNEDGTLILPEGVKPKTAKVGPMPSQISAAEKLVGKPRPGKLKDGKQERYTYETALEDVMAASSGQQAGTGLPGWGERPAAAPAAAPTGLNTSSAPAPAAPQITSMNTNILSRAGDKFNVEMPDGTTRLMTPAELIKIGYQFPQGTGLSRPWYADLLPSR
jgi:hypothetical protein